MTEEQITLHFREFDTTTGVVLEVVASGDYIENRIEKIRAKFPHVGNSKTLVLGGFDGTGGFHDEFAFYLDIEHGWIWNQIPESVARQAWGKAWIKPESKLR